MALDKQIDAAEAAQYKTGLTRSVAEFVTRTRAEDIPAEAVENCKKSILDEIGLALAGSVAKSGGLVRDYLGLLGVSGGHRDRQRSEGACAFCRLREWRRHPRG